MKKTSELLLTEELVEDPKGIMVPKATKLFVDGCTVQDVIAILSQLPPDSIFQARDWSGDWGFLNIEIMRLDKCVYIESNKEVTKWYRLNKETNVFEFNHIENGHSEAEKPTPKFPTQNGWVNEEWSSEWAYLVDGKLVNVDGKLVDGKIDE